MAIDRTTRETTTRANNTRRKPWSPPSKLDAPNLLLGIHIGGSEPPYKEKMIKQMCLLR